MLFLNDQRRSDSDGLGAVPRLERIVRIHRALKDGRHCTATQLARELDVHVRTIYRDVDYLRDELGAPVVAHGNRGYTYSDPRYVLPELTVTEGELLAFLVADLVLPKVPAPYARRLRQGLHRLSQGLGAAIAVHPAELPGPDLPLRQVQIRFGDQGNLTLQVPSDDDLVPWILSQGARARVLNPPELVDRVRAEVRAMAALY